MPGPGSWRLSVVLNHGSPLISRDHPRHPPHAPVQGISRAEPLASLIRLLLAGAVLLAWMAASADAAETKVVYLRGMEPKARLRDTAGRQWTGWRAACDRR